MAQPKNKKNKAKINAISILSNLIADLSRSTMWHVTRAARDNYALDVLRVICTRLSPGVLSVRVGVVCWLLNVPATC